MAYNNEDIKIAQSIINSPSLTDFLSRYLFTPPTQWSKEALEKDAAELGYLVKADYLANQYIQQRFAEIKKMAQMAESKGTASPIAPK